MNRYILPKVVSGLCCLALFAASEGVAQAQCDTCATPVVAYQPVAVQPTVTYTPYTGWYPGKWLDNMRMRRYGYSAPTTYTAAYAPYTASYAPTYSSTYAPYAASYAPYSASYAPSYSTSYYAPTSMYSPYVTAYAPLGQRQVLMRPVVVASPVISGGCNTCAALESPCSTCEAAPACSACSGSAAYAGSVEPATYVEPACSSCAAGSGSVTYPAPSGSSQMAAPSLLPQEAAPQQSNYPPITPPVTPPAGDAQQPADPGPAATDSNSSTYFEAPKLFSPRDRTAQSKPINRAPSVDVWTAVYDKPVSSEGVSTAVKSTSVDTVADGWHSVSAP